MRDKYKYILMIITLLLLSSTTVFAAESSLDCTSDRFLDDLLTFFKNKSILGINSLLPHAKYLLCVFGVIDLCICWNLYEGELRFSALIGRIMKIGFFFFLIFNWHDGVNLVGIVQRSFIKAGLVAAGVDGLSTNIFGPSIIVDQGFKVIGDLTSAMQKFGTVDLGTAIIYLLGIVLTICTYFFIAFQIVLTQIEFYIFITLAAILLPFGSLKYTSFLFQKILSGLFTFATKLMVTYFILGIAQSTILATSPMKAGIEFSNLLKQCISMGTIGLLVWKIPSIASGMMSGSPSMDGGSMLAGAAGFAVGAASPVATRALGAAAGGVTRTMAAAAGGIAQSAGGQAMGIGGMASAIGGMSSALRSGASSALHFNSEGISKAARNFNANASLFNSNAGRFASNASLGNIGSATLGGAKGTAKGVATSTINAVKSGIKGIPNALGNSKIGRNMSGGFNSVNDKDKPDNKGK
jgi:type IV secretion system protein TrbL